MLRSTDQQRSFATRGVGSIGPGSLQLFLIPLLVWCAGVVLVMVAWQAGMDERSIASLLAVGFVCLTASMVGQAPVAAVGRGEPQKLPPAMLVSVAFRAGSTVVSAVALVRIGLLQGPVAASGFVVWYALMLAADVWVASKHIAINFPASNRSPERA